LITDVFRFRLHCCTIIPTALSSEIAGRRYLTLKILDEGHQSYRHPPRVGKKKLAKVEAAPPAVQEIAWKAQARLTARYRALARRGKRPTLVVTAIARELSGFIWAVSRAVGAPATPAM